MDGIEREWVPYQCEKLGDLAHATVDYFRGQEIRFILGIDCDRVEDCGIRLSAFPKISNIPMYSLDCPLHVYLENELKLHRPRQD